MPDFERPWQDGRTHPAIDIYATAGTAIVAPVSGTVVRTGVNTDVGGNWVVLQGNDGVEYYFAHMQDPTLFDRGDTVNNGALLGRVGDTGSAKGKPHHLHFSMKASNGAYIDPRPWLSDGVPANPNQYVIDPYQRIGMSTRDAMANDPFFNPAAEQAAPHHDPMREVLRNVMGEVSNAVAGGLRKPIGQVMESQVRPDDLDQALPSKEQPDKPSTRPDQVRKEVE